MISIKADQYVKDEGSNGGKTIFTFTLTATDLFDPGKDKDGTKAKVGIKILDAGMDGNDGLALLADKTNDVRKISNTSGSVYFDRDKDPSVKKTEIVTDEFGLKEEVTTITYTKTIQVEVHADKHVEAHEMFGVALTQGWMLDSKENAILTFGGPKMDNSYAHPKGNWNVNEMALQVVRNDDGAAKADAGALAKLGDQIKKVSNSNKTKEARENEETDKNVDDFDVARKRLDKDVKGEGTKEQPRKLTPEDRLDELKKAQEEAEKEFDEAEKRGDDKGQEQALDKYEKAQKEIEEIQEEIKKKDEAENSDNSSSETPDSFKFGFDGFEPNDDDTDFQLDLSKTSTDNKFAELLDEISSTNSGIYSTGEDDVLIDIYSSDNFIF